MTRRADTLYKSVRFMVRAYGRMITALETSYPGARNDRWRYEGEFYGAKTVLALWLRTEHPTTDYERVMVLALDAQNAEFRPRQAGADPEWDDAFIARLTADLALPFAEEGTDKDENPYDHEARPDDNPEPGDRCKVCGETVTWMGPGPADWLHSDDPRS